MVVAVEKVTRVRSLERTLRGLETKVEGPGRLKVLEPSGLVILECLQSPQDFLDRNLAPGADIDLLVEGLHLLGARAFEPQQNHVIGISQTDPQSVPAPTEAVERLFFAGDEVDCSRRSEIGVGKHQLEIGGVRIRLRNHTQTEIFADKRPGPAGAGRARVRVEDEIATKLPSHHYEGTEINADFGTGIEECDCHPCCCGLGHPGDSLLRNPGHGQRIEHHRLAGIEIAESGNGKRQIVAGSKRDEIEVRGDLLVVEIAEEVGVSLQRAGDEGRVGCGAGHGYRRAFDQECMIPCVVCTALRLPHSLYEKALSARADYCHEFPELGLEIVEVVGNRPWGVEDGPHPGDSARGADGGD